MIFVIKQLNHLASLYFMSTICILELVFLPMKIISCVFMQQFVYSKQLG